MKKRVLFKNYSQVNNSLKLLFLVVFACSSNTNILAVGGNGDNNDIIPEYVIDAPWDNGVNSGNTGAPENNSENNSNNGTGNSGENFGDQVSESDLQEISKLDLNEEDLCDEQSLFAKIKSKLPNIKISKELIVKALKVAAVAGVAGVASYAGYKLTKAAAIKIKDAAIVVSDAVKGAVSTTCKSLVVVAVCILLVKYAVSK